ncbi:hypothetical protein ACRRTK_022921 [Alexandromys fortis]
MQRADVFVAEEVVTGRRKQMRQDRHDASSHSAPTVTPAYLFRYGLCLVSRQDFSNGTI